ncbi:glucosidase II beta subunit-like protein-domain-containing protein [Xylaria sp. CBS 124048]|nr:glucosidase II beta subunit-like protein-domain-containing protein [Xylaria sp. CBS 124048]
MRRHFSSFLVAWACAHVCRARQPGFSIHHDLLAYPQFEVVFSDAYISESDAQALIETSDPAHPDYDASLTRQTDITSSIRPATAHESILDADSGHRTAGLTYEVMSMPPHRYLCAIPLIEPPPAPNKTATELAKAEEARELARASAHGWDLINELDGTCLHYMSGWWSYRFCYGQDVVQFHAVAASVKSGPPMRDVTTAEYVLGRVPNSHENSRSSRRREQTQQQRPGTPAGAPPNTDLQVKGDQRYLVQRMGDGTICDLTGRERTIEVQYHCSPGSTQDRIGWIKEVTTCSYLMVINTPRLCVDIAFQPPKEEKANTISCRAIVPESAQVEWHAQKALEARAAMLGHAKAAAKSPIVIGGVVLGGRQMLVADEDGKEAPRLSPPKNYQSDSIPGLGKLIDIIASASGKDGGGEVEVMTEEELQTLNINPEVIERLKKEIQQLAGDRGWKLELVEAPGNARELLGIIDSEEEDDDDDEKEEANANANGKENGKKADKKQGNQNKAESNDDGENTDEDEYYTEEL